MIGNKSKSIGHQILFNDTTQEKIDTSEFTQDSPSFANFNRKIKKFSISESPDSISDEFEPLKRSRSDNLLIKKSSSKSDNQPPKPPIFFSAKMMKKRLSMRVFVGRQQPKKQPRQKKQRSFSLGSLAKLSIHRRRMSEQIISENSFPGLVSPGINVKMREDSPVKKIKENHMKFFPKKRRLSAQSFEFLRKKDNKDNNHHKGSKNEQIFTSPEPKKKPSIKRTNSMNTIREHKEDVDFGIKETPLRQTPIDSTMASSFHKDQVKNGTLDARLTKSLDLSSFPPLTSYKDDKVIELSINEFKALFLGPEKFLIIDCRYEHEFQGGHFINAFHFPLKEDIDRLYEKIYNKGEKTTIVFHCEKSLCRGPGLQSTLQQDCGVIVIIL
eukprot:UN24484